MTKARALLEQYQSVIEISARGCPTRKAAAVKQTGRLATKKQAARYIGVSGYLFDRMVSNGVLPGPLPGTKMWDKNAIDAALDAASGLVGPANPYDRWKKTHCG